MPPGSAPYSANECRTSVRKSGGTTVLFVPKHMLRDVFLPSPWGKVAKAGFSRLLTDEAIRSRQTHRATY